MGRLALRWVPSDNFTADLSFDYYDDETNGPPLLITRVDGFPESATAIPGGNFPFIHNLFAGFSPDFGGPNPIVCTLPDANLFTTYLLPKSPITNAPANPPACRIAPADIPWEVESPASTNNLGVQLTTK